MRFAYGYEQALAALASNDAYRRHRREHGEKSARASDLGQAISYRFRRDHKGWRVFAATEMLDVPVVTDRRRGAVGVDLNADHLDEATPWSAAASSGRSAGRWGTISGLAAVVTGGSPEAGFGGDRGGERCAITRFIARRINVRKGALAAGFHRRLPDHRGPVQPRSMGPPA